MIIFLNNYALLKMNFAGVALGAILASGVKAKGPCQVLWPWLIVNNSKTIVKNYVEITHLVYGC